MKNKESRHKGQRRWKRLEGKGLEERTGNNMSHTLTWAEQKWHTYTQISRFMIDTERCQFMCKDTRNREIGRDW